MKRYLDQNQIGNWVNSVGGTTKATKMIMNKLECSISKAEKMAACRYPGALQPLEQIALSRLTKIHRDDLFPPVTARGKAS